MQPTFLCSCVLIWQQKITKHYVTHIAFVLLVCTFFLLGFENWRNCAPSSVDAAGVAKRASRNLYFRLWGITKNSLAVFPCILHCLDLGGGPRQTLNFCTSLHTAKHKKSAILAKLLLLKLPRETSQPDPIFFHPLA